MGLLTLKINKFFVYRAFYFFLIVFSIFRERVSIPFWPYYIKLLEAYLAVSMPFILFVFMKNARSLSTTSATFILILFISFFVLNYISGHYSTQYTLTGGSGTRFSGPPSHHENIIYYFRLGLAFLLCLTVVVGVTTHYPFLIGSIYSAYRIAGVAVLLWIVLFPAYTKTTLNRFTGPIGDPNYASAFLIIGMNISAYLALVTKNKLMYIGNFVLAVAFFTTIVISLSRGALLGALSSLTILFFATVVSKRSSFIRGVVLVKKACLDRVMVILLLMVVSTALFFATSTSRFDDFARRLSIKNIVSEKDQHRQTLWRLGIRSIAQNPIGYGMGQMKTKLLNLRGEVFGRSSTEVHNIVLQVGGAFGWLGMFIFIMFLLFLLRVCVRLLRKKTYMIDSPYAYPIPLVTSFIGLFVQAMLFNFLFLKHFWMVVALVLAYYEYEKRQRVRQLKRSLAQ